MRTGARVLVERLQRTRSAILTRNRIARVLHRNLAQRSGEADWAAALEHRSSLLEADRARTTVLTPRSGSRVARIQVLTELANVPGGAAGRKQQITVR